MFLARLLSRWTLSWPLLLGRLISSQDPRLSPPWSSSHHLRLCVLSSKVRTALIKYFEMMKMPRILFSFLKFRINPKLYLHLLQNLLWSVTWALPITLGCGCTLLGSGSMCVDSVSPRHASGSVPPAWSCSPLLVPGSTLCSTTLSCPAVPEGTLGLPSPCCCTNSSFCLEHVFYLLLALRCRELVLSTNENALPLVSLYSTVVSLLLHPHPGLRPPEAQVCLFPIPPAHGRVPSA